MAKTLRDKFNDDIANCIYALWADQSADTQASMAAFDKLPPEIREAVNNYPLNVLPETVVRAVRIWGAEAVLDFLRRPLP